ncbi:MAG: iron ABC transporter substrate-binding protein [Chloroflexi bacterium]|nr:MAG: iron ABC transporter substrate-binding protein [Chloroflexota bacterium]
MLAGGCAGKAGTPSPASPSPTTFPVAPSKPSKVTITDMVGRTVELPAEVSKIACAGPGALRLIVYLEAGDKVIGVESAEKRWGSAGRPYAMAHPELKDLPSIGPGGPGRLPNTEALVKLSPDVLFMTYVEARTANNIQSQTGIPVVALSYGEHAAFLNEPLFRSLTLAGKILGKEERAAEVIAFITERREDLKVRTQGIPEEQKPTVYVGGIGYRGTHGIESTEGNFPPFSAVQARNVVDSLGEGHHSIDKEKLLKWDPDVIFIDEGGFRLVKQDYQKNPEFYHSLKAFKNENIYGILPFNFYTTNVGTALADAYYIGKVLYPEKFKDIEPDKKADDIYVFLVGEPIYDEMAKDFGGFGKIDLEAGEVRESWPISP